MADDTNEDSWLYGTSNPDSTTNEEEKPVEENVVVDVKSEAENEAQALDAITNPGNEYDTKPAENGTEEEFMLENYGDFEEATNEMEETDLPVEAEPKQVVDETVEDAEVSAKSEEEDDDDDSDDDINVVIGDIKATASYNIKQRANLIAGGNVPSGEKTKTTQSGKFSIEDFEGVGTINGVPSHEFSIDSLEEKPWRKPGADITDYFNYGFNEETWRAYCERQKRMRVVESGVGLSSLTQNQNTDRQNQDSSGGNSGSAAANSNSGMGSDNTHGSGQGLGSSRSLNAPRGPRPISTIGGKEENTIQVMTAEMREYQRAGGMGHMNANFNDEPFFPEPDNFDYGYEPTQESQWNNESPGWIPSGVKELTSGPSMIPSQIGVPSQMVGPPQLVGPPQMGGPPPQMGGQPPPQMGGPPPQISGPPPQLVGPPPSMGVPSGPMMGHSSNHMHGNPPPLMGGMRMASNIGMGPPPGMPMMGPGPMSGPPMRVNPLMGPPRMVGAPMINPMERAEEERERERRRRWERERDRERERRRSKSREKERDRRDERERDYERADHRSRDRDRDRDKEREEKRERDKEKERERPDDAGERVDEDRERRKRDRDRDREREREKERERVRRERSRSRERNKRRSKSREKDRDRSGKSTSTGRSEKKKSHRKEKEKDDE